MACDLVFVTGNQGKADYLAKLLGMPIDHHKIDLDEIQSLDLRVITEHKLRQAYDIAKRPVLVEDTGLAINALGRLPGPFVKWFIEDIGIEGICRMADISLERTAVAACCYGYYDGTDLKLFYSELSGRISDQPRGGTGFGWNPIFIPAGETLTMGEMSEEEFSEHYLRIKPIRQAADYLRSKSTP